MLAAQGERRRADPDGGTVCIRILGKLLGAVLSRFTFLRNH
jgi:hypothetical protein